MKSKLTPTVTAIISTVLLSTLALAETSREEQELKSWAFQEQASVDYDPTAAPVRLLRILVFDAAARRKIWEVADQTVINPTDVLASAGSSTKQYPVASNPQSREERELKAWALHKLKDDFSPGSGPRTLLCILWHHPPARQAIWEIAQETVIDDIPVVGSVRFNHPVERPASQADQSLQAQDGRPDQSLQVPTPRPGGNRVAGFSTAAGVGLLSILALAIPWRRFCTRSEELAR